jgi:hypothetical protein
MQSWCWYLSSSSVIVSPGGWVRRGTLCAAICPISGSGSSATYCQPATVAGSVFWELAWRAAPPRFSSALKAPRPLCCMFFSPPCLLFSFFFFLQGRGQSVQGAKLVYPRGGCRDTAGHLFAHLLVCVSQAGLEPISGCTGALLLSQCNVAWKRFAQAKGLGCRSFAYSWWSFSAKCGSSVSERFLIYGAHGVCFLPLVAILDPWISLWWLQYSPTEYVLFPGNG